MTEEEAKKKICPIGAIARVLSPTISKDFTTCLGSECALWRVQTRTVRCEADAPGAVIAGDGRAWKVGHAIGGRCGLIN